MLKTLKLKERTEFMVHQINRQKNPSENVENFSDFRLQVGEQTASNDIYVD